MKDDNINPIHDIKIATGNPMWSYLTNNVELSVLRLGLDELHIEADTNIGRVVCGSVYSRYKFSLKNEQ